MDVTIIKREHTGSRTTGTTSWLYRAIVEYILDVRAEFGVLLIDPQLLRDWNEAEVTRVYRSSIYEIKIQRTGKKEVYLDGERLLSNIIPQVEPGKVHSVIVNIKMYHVFELQDRNDRRSENKGKGIRT